MLASLPPLSQYHYPWTTSARNVLRRRLEDDVVLTFRTGSTVFAQRLPIHLLEILAPRDGVPWEYIPNKLFYSDGEVRIAGVEVRNPLTNMSDDVKRLPDFTKAYTEIQEALVRQIHLV